MTKIKLCGLSRPCDIVTACELKPEYIGFVFAQKSHRYVSPEKAAALKKLLDSDISSVGVFADENVDTVADLLNKGVIDIAQLHGNENDEYIGQLRKLTAKPVIKAFRIDTKTDVIKAENSSADYILLDSGTGGTGMTFDWDLVKHLTRPYFLAGGLCPDNVKDAVNSLRPYAVDVSSGIETDGLKDKRKMAAFVTAVRKEEK